jgi:hypothetical protein
MTSCRIVRSHPSKVPGTQAQQRIENATKPLWHAVFHGICKVLFLESLLLVESSGDDYSIHARTSRDLSPQLGVHVRAESSHGTPFNVSAAGVSKQHDVAVLCSIMGQRSYETTK